MTDRGTTGPHFKPGDVVEVRAPMDILATLDDAGSLDAVPFMPEMAQHIGKRFIVSKRVEKICDTIGPGGSRRMRDTVFLEDLRCDGSAHGGCQAECRIYWKEAWLSRVDAAPAPEVEPDGAAAARLGVVTHASTLSKNDEQGADAFSCQATEAFRATEPLRLLEPGQYVRELSSGNVGVLHLARVAFRAAWGSAGHRLGLKGDLPMKRAGDDHERGEQLGLQPGDWVEVKSPEEIGRTLDSGSTHRGLHFSAEMLPACGRKFRVRRRVDRIIDERTGRLLSFQNDCIVLEGFSCDGDLSPGRWFCRRELYPYWREVWLRRTDEPVGISARAASGAANGRPEDIQATPKTASATSASRATSKA